MAFCHASREKHGFRAWWHFAERSSIKIEVAWLRSFCFLEAEVTDEGWTFKAALPGLAIWLSFDGCGLWQPKAKHIFTWDNNREVWLTDRRECGISMHDWTIRINPWSRWGEWRTVDPWYVKGLSFDLKRLLGKQRYVTETIKAGIPIEIPFAEGVYKATAKFEICTWKRPLWFAHTRRYTSVDVPKGLPFSGKGENSWDCGDDGLFGYSVEGHDLEKAIAHGVESVLKSRRKYGHASDAAIREALI